MKLLFATFAGLLCLGQGMTYAGVTTAGYYRLGEEVPGATNNQTAPLEFPSTGGGKSIYRFGTAPSLSTNTAVAGSSLSTAFLGGGYSNSTPLVLVRDNWGVEAWVRGNGAISGAACIVYNGDSAANGMGIYQFNGQYVGLVGGIAFVGGTTMKPGVWTHLAIVTTAGRTTFYVDGISRGTGAAPNAATGGNARFSVALRSDGAESFRGSVDEVRIFRVQADGFRTGDLLLQQVPPPPEIPWISARRSGANLVLAWSHGSLEQADSVAGPWNTLAGYLPPWSNPPTARISFYRASTASVAPLTLTQAVSWLERRSSQMIRDCRRTTTSGIAAFPPQVGGGYDAFWLRDYAYMLEGNLAVFSEQQLRDACRFFVAGQRADGAMVDCIKFDGTPYYMPGYGSMGANPVADGGMFAVSVAWHSFQGTKDTNLITDILDFLVKGLNYVPRETNTGLVYIKPGTTWDRASYGFTDSIRKQGAEMFCSLLFVQASRQLADLLEISNRSADATIWRNEATRVTESVRATFWDANLGLFRAATVVCNQPDLWGSAFAVRIGVATPQQATRIADYFKANYTGIIKRGQLRHLPAGMNWQTTSTAPGTYQNGAFWATPIGWFVYTLDLVDPALADATVLSMVDDFISLEDENECINDGYANVSHYVVSATLPLEGIRAMLSRRSGG